MASSLASNLESVKVTILRHAEVAGRDPQRVTIVAVTKMVPVARIREALTVGLHTFGENRVQEALPKLEALRAEECEWHLIGHLQTNKAKLVTSGFRMVHSIDSVRVVEALASRLQHPLEVLIEVNVAEEPQKTGARPADVPTLTAAVVAARNLRLMGLMTIAPMSSDPEAARPVFRSLRALRDETSQRLSLPLPELSMGMTDDYPVAVEEGASMLRLGRALFGPR